jgi:hypothetical protein
MSTDQLERVERIFYCCWLRHAALAGDNTCKICTQVTGYSHSDFLRSRWKQKTSRTLSRSESYK